MLGPQFFDQHTVRFSMYSQQHENDRIKPCLQACSSGGCTSTPPLSLLTASAPPQNQPPPRVTATGPHTLHASWEPPSQPNGRTSNMFI